MVAAYLIAIASATMGQTSTVSHTVTFSDDLQSPGRLAPAPGGGVYVTDQAAGRILEYGVGGGVPAIYDVPEGPVGLAYRPDIGGDGGRVLVSLADGSLGVYSAGLVPVGGASVIGVLDEPNDMAMYPYTTDVYRVFVVDSGASQVVVFEEDPLDTWTEVNRFSTDGSGLGETVHPQAITVDAASGMVIVTDVDNFRAQVFDVDGYFQYRFGHRMFYGGWDVGEFAWFARSEGVATDTCGNIYISDALMGTVRVFDPTGAELDVANPAVSYGTAAGEVRIPIDIAIEGGQLFVASSYNSAVEVYDVACTLAAMAPSAASGLATIGSDREIVRSADVRGKVARAPATPDNPLDILATIESGAYNRGSDLNLDRTVDYADLQVAIDAFGVGTLDDFLAVSGGVADSSFHPPHVLDTPDACGRCHGNNGLPGGMLTAAGQENLCLSCHTGGGLAMDMIVSGSDKGMAHPIGIPADQGISMGPDPDGLLAQHLDGGDIKCSTCHDQHSNLYEPYLRNSVGNAYLCGECHFQADEWENAGHGDPEGEAFVHYDWTGSNRSSCRKCHSGLGFIDYTNGLANADQRGDEHVHSCVVCHGVHENGNAELLRVTGEVTLPGGIVVNAGTSASCLECHNGRRDPASGSLTPHYLLGGVMLEGVNGQEFGATLTSSRHTTVAACTDCHMADSPAAGNPGAGKVGGHSFNISVHDSADPDYGFENVANACNAAACHGNTGDLTVVNRTAYGDFDGDGFVDGVQDEVTNLLALVYTEIHNAGAVFLGYYPYWDLSGLDYTGATCVGGLDDGLGCAVDADCDDLVLDDADGDCVPVLQSAVRGAIWNYEYVDNDGSLGVHNTDYAVGLLQVSVEALTGSAVSGADLRYTPAGVSETVVTVDDVNVGAAVLPAGAWTVDFRIEDEFGNPIAMADLNRLTLRVSGPSDNYQLVIYSETSGFVQNGDGTYTYIGAAFPTVYTAPLNDSGAFTEDELTGLPLVDGTYTVLIESRQVFGSLRKAGDATRDFVVDGDGVAPPALAPRQFVTQNACNACHLDLQLHGANRYTVSGCVVCHTAGGEDRINADPLKETPGVSIEFVDMIHKIHTGHGLKSVEATSSSADPYRYEIIGYGNSLHDFSDIGFPVIPDGTMACDACHGGAADEASIYTNITRRNCGSCHDDIDFTTGTVLDFNVADEVCIGGIDDGAACTVDTDCDDVVLDDALGTCGPDPAKRYAGLGTLEDGDLGNVAYRVFPGGIDHTFANDTACFGCHGPTMWQDVEVIHRHSTDDAAEGSGLAVVIDSVGGMSGGAGTYFVSGDRPVVTFHMLDETADPLAIPGTADTAVVDRMYFMVVGPTTLYQQIIPDERAINGGAVSAAPADWIDNGDGTYTYTMAAFPLDYPAQENTIGQPPVDQLFDYVGGWGQQYDALGVLLDAGSYSVMVWGRRVTPSGDREPMMTDVMDVPFGAADPIVPWPATVNSDKCNACHGVLAFHGNQREGVQLCAGCHTAGGQDGGTVNGIDLRRMIHKLHNAQNLTNLPYELNGYSGIADFSKLLISSMPGGAAECEVCHATDDWKTPPVRSNMRTWMVACTSCHDSAGTMTHVDMMTTPGTFDEQCATCHGDGAAYSVESVHQSP